MTHAELRRRRQPSEERTWPLMEREDLMRVLVWDGEMRCALHEGRRRKRTQELEMAQAALARVEKKYGRG